MCWDWCCGCDEETIHKIKLYSFAAVLWAATFAVGCAFILYAPLAWYDQRAKHRWHEKRCRVDGWYLTNDNPNRRFLAEEDDTTNPEMHSSRRRRVLKRRFLSEDGDDNTDEDAHTYYAVLQVTVLTDGGAEDYRTTAAKFPSWASGVGAGTLHGWDRKKPAKRWAKSFDVDGTYTCWRRSSDKSTVAISNPGYHYRWQVALGATAMALSAGPILALFGLMVGMYYVLVVKPRRWHRREARRVATLRAEGDARLDTVETHLV